INLGEIVIDGEDILGDGVNIAARLEGQAPPGGILASDLVHSQVAGKVAIVFADAGELRLKNIERPLRARRWSGEELAGGRPIALSGSAPAPDLPSLAVLPFTA